jgi:RPA family protein
MSADFKARQTAYLVRIEELISGSIVKDNPDQPSAFFLPIRKLTVSRVNVTGIVVGREASQGYDELLIDDGSGAISLRNFDTSINLAGLKIGDMVGVIGRVREYNGSRYIIPEIVKVLSDKRELVLHELQTKALSLPATNDTPAKPKSAASAVLDEASPKQMVYELVKELDRGEGADIQELAAKSHLADIDAIINSLIKDGEIFKVGPGRVKVL